MPDKIVDILEEVRDCGLDMDVVKTAAMVRDIAEQEAGVPEMFTALKGILLVARPCSGADYQFEKRYIGIFEVFGNRLETAVEALAKYEQRQEVSNVTHNI